MLALYKGVDIFAAMRSKVHLGSALRTLGEVTAAGGWGRCGEEVFLDRSHNDWQSLKQAFERLGAELKARPRRDMLERD